MDYNKLSKLVFLGNADKLEKLKAKQKYYGQYQMFTCKRSCHDFPFEVAAEYNFNCPMCNDTLMHVDYVEKQKELQTQICAIEEENAILSLFLKETNKKQ
jgi:transcription initiation factor TFIIE subunit alpha